MGTVLRNRDYYYYNKPTGGVSLGKEALRSSSINHGIVDNDRYFYEEATRYGRRRLDNEYIDEKKGYGCNENDYNDVLHDNNNVEDDINCNAKSIFPDHLLSYSRDLFPCYDDDRDNHVKTCHHSGHTVDDQRISNPHRFQDGLPGQRRGHGNLNQNQNQIQIHDQSFRLDNNSGRDHITRMHSKSREQDDRFLSAAPLGFINNNKNNNHNNHSHHQNVKSNIPSYNNHGENNNGYLNVHPHWTPSTTKAVDFDRYRIRKGTAQGCNYALNNGNNASNNLDNNTDIRNHNNHIQPLNQRLHHHHHHHHQHSSYQRIDDNIHQDHHYHHPLHSNQNSNSADKADGALIHDEECNERNENCAFWVSQCQQSSYSLSNRPCWQSNFPFEKLYYSDIDSSSSRCTSVSPSSSLSSLSSPSSYSSPFQRPKKNTSNSTSCPYSSTYQQYFQRRRARTRKFRLNLFMYANLYRKQRRAESSYEIYHNPMEDPDSIYTSFSNPNYFMNRPTSLSTSTNNNKPGGTNNHLKKNGDETASLEKLSLASDASGHYSDYSSCEPTPTTPDRSLILHKLHSADDEYDDYDDVDDDDVYGDHDIHDDDNNKDDDDDNENRRLVEDSTSRSSCDDSAGEEAVMMMREGNGGKKKGRSANRKASNGEDPHVYYGIGGLPWSKSKGILGYLEMLEKQAQARDAAQENGCHRGSEDDEDSGDKENDEYGDKKKTSSKANGDGENPNEQQENEKFEPTTEINSPDSNDSGIQPGDKILSPDCPSDVETTNRSSEQDSGGKDQNKADPDKLPDGWQKHEDEDGPYFWHVKSGTIQREPPPPAPPDGPSLCSPRSISLASDTTSTSSNSMPSTPTSVGSVERHLAEFEAQSLHYAAKSLQALSHPDRRSRDMSGEKGVRYAVRSLGWVRIAEEDLNPERSSKAVNKCIVDLSLGRDDLTDSVARWGDGKELYMDMDMHSLRLVNPTDGVVLNSQPIHSIRVWGVGRDNCRDFAYVARDRKTRMHMCHVFHCDVQARQIANTLRDICKKIMLERNLHQNAVARLARPTDLPNLDKVGHHGQHSNGEKLSFQNLYNNARFPTPMEEPRKVIRCHYLGVLEVPRPTGREVLNEAIQNLYYRIPPEKWMFANVAIAPSTITIIENGNCEAILEECRVRFLSFMGIAADNVKLGAFIMHTAQNKFMCHVFHCEPSAGPLCKTIEAACKLRYQKCMDAHPQQNKAGLQAKNIGEFISSGVKAGVQGLKEAKTNAFNGVRSLFKGKNPGNS